MRHAAAARQPEPGRSPAFVLQTAAWRRVAFRAPPTRSAPWSGVHVSRRRGREHRRAAGLRRKAAAPVQRNRARLSTFTVSLRRRTPAQRSAWKSMRACSSGKRGRRPAPLRPGRNPQVQGAQARRRGEADLVQAGNAEFQGASSSATSSNSSAVVPGRRPSMRWRQTHSLGRHPQQAGVQRPLADACHQRRQVRQRGHAASARSCRSSAGAALRHPIPQPPAMAMSGLLPPLPPTCWRHELTSRRP